MSERSYHGATSRSSALAARDWQRVDFTGESWYCLSTVGGRRHVYRQGGKRTAVCGGQEVMTFGGGVRGGVCAQERTPLVIVNGNLTGQRHVDAILRQSGLPFLPQHSRVVNY